MIPTGDKLHFTYEIRRHADKAIRWFRSCATCGSISVPIDLLCERCWLALSTQLNRAEATLQPAYPFAVHSLLTWTPEEPWIRDLLRGFKRGHAVSAAGTFARLMSDFEHQTERPVFVVPPSSDGKLDHSSVLGIALCKFFPYSQLLVLQNSPFEKQGAQKEKTATERASRRFLAVYPSGEAPNAEFVFVDDVITSGSTAMAAYMALGDPPIFQSWTLVSRPKLAGP
jgi:predicted amidophosphoribosyltransferase